MGDFFRNMWILRKQLGGVYGIQFFLRITSTMNRLIQSARTPATSTGLNPGFLLQPALLKLNAKP